MAKEVGVVAVGDGLVDDGAVHGEDGGIGAPEGTEDCGRG